MYGRVRRGSCCNQTKTLGARHPRNQKPHARRPKPACLCPARSWNGTTVNSYIDAAAHTSMAYTEQPVKPDKKACTHLSSAAVASALSTSSSADASDTRACCTHTAKSRRALAPCTGRQHMAQRFSGTVSWWTVLWEPASLSSFPPHSKLLALRSRVPKHPSNCLHPVTRHNRPHWHS